MARKSGSKGKPEGKASADRKKVKSKGRGKIIAGVIAAAASVAVIALAFLYFREAEQYYDHFYPGTVINGEDVSGLTVLETEALLQSKVDGYKLNVIDPQGRETLVTAGELVMLYEADGSVPALMDEQKPLLWIFQKNKGKNVSVPTEFSFSADRVNSFTNALACVLEGVPPADAYAKINEETGLYEIVPEVEGSMIDTERLKADIISAIESGQDTLDMRNGDYYVKPAVRSTDKDLVAYVESENEILRITNTSVSFPCEADETPFVLEKDSLRYFLSYDENKHVYLDKDKLKEWYKHWAYERHYLDDQFLFVTGDGVLISVPEGEDYGWALDIDQSVDKLYDTIQAGGVHVFTPVLVNPETGKKQTEELYVEIDIPNQRVRMYNNGILLVDSECVSGKPDWETPVNGVWHVFYKTKNYTLRGPRQEDGNFEWESHVSYWMPFNDDIGLHDADWRTYFGGNLYMTEGSHGCVNLPIENAEQLYNAVVIGTKVIVY